MTETIILKRPKITNIGVIPIHLKRKYNDNISFDILNVFLKKEKYFISFEKKEMDYKQQIKDFFNENYNLEIKIDNVIYFCNKKNISLFILDLDFINSLNKGSMNDFEYKNDYVWKTFFNTNFINNPQQNYSNIHLQKKIVTEQKKHRIYIEELYYFIKKFKV